MTARGRATTEPGERRLRRGVLAAWVCFAALVSIQCGQEIGRDEADVHTLTIHAQGEHEFQFGLGGLYGPLVYLRFSRDSEAGAEPEPRLLERWDHNPDYTEWTVHVREGVRWHDGAPVTAEDVKFSMELWSHPDVGYNVRFFETITTLDSHTLRITYPEPNAGPVSEYSWIEMLPKHLLDALEPGQVHEWPFWTHPVGNGPYRYVRHSPAIMTELEENPDYYGEAPKIPRIVLRYGGDGLTELLSENVDLAFSVSPMDALRLGRDPRFRIYHYVEYQNTVAIAWNHRNPLFSDVAVRRALTMAIDRRELHRVLNLPESFPIYDVPVQGRHHVLGEAPEPFPFDPNRAAQLFADAGWVDTDADGVLDREGEDFEFTLLTTHTAEAVYVQDQLRRVGIRMEIGTYARNVINQRTLDGEFDAATVAGSRIAQAGRTLRTGYHTLELDRHKDAYRTTIDPIEKEAHVRAIWRIVQADLPVTYLHLGVHYLAAHRRVRGIQSDLPWPFADLWIDDEGAADNPSTVGDGS